MTIIATLNLEGALRYASRIALCVLCIFLGDVPQWMTQAISHDSDPEIYCLGDDKTETIDLSVRVHLLHADDAPTLTAKLSDEEVKKAFAGVNEIWKAAGITWQIESIVREEVTESDRPQQPQAGPGMSGALSEVLPRDLVTDHLWHVFFVREIGFAPGVYVPSVPAVIQAEKDPFGGVGLDGDLVRILAHELGHSLGLAHVPCGSDGNLMAPNCQADNRTRLTEMQVSVAREVARSGAPFGGSLNILQYLNQHAESLSLTNVQRAELASLVEDLQHEKAQIDEKRDAIFEESRAARASGAMDMMQAQDRQRRLSELQSTLRSAEAEALASLLNLLDAHQRRVADCLKDRHAVMVGNSGPPSST